MYHKDKRIQQSTIQLLDALCSYERNTGRTSSLILIHDGDLINLLIAENGKPINHSPFLIKTYFESLIRKLSGDDENSKY